MDYLRKNEDFLETCLEPPPSIRNGWLRRTCIPNSNATDLNGGAKKWNSSRRASCSVKPIKFLRISNESRALTRWNANAFRRPHARNTSVDCERTNYRILWILKESPLFHFYCYTNILAAKSHVIHGPKSWTMDEFMLWNKSNVSSFGQTLERADRRKAPKWIEINPMRCEKFVVCLRRSPNKSIVRIIRIWKAESLPLPAE